MLSWMLISSLVSAVTFGIAIRKRDAPKSRYFILLTLAITVYSLGRAFESVATGLESAYYGVILAYIGLPYIPVFMLLFLLDYFGIKIDKRPWLVVWIPLILSSIFVTVPELRHLYYTEYSFLPGPPISQVVVEPNVYYYVMFGYHAVLSLACLILAAWGIKKFRETERSSSIIVFIAVLLPTIAEVLYVLRLTPMQLEIAPIALAISIILLCVAVFRLNLLRVLPMAKDAILEQMNDSIILTDPDNRFIEANAAAKEHFPAIADIHIGQKIDIDTLFPNMSEGQDNQTLVTIESENAPKYYHLVENVIEQHEKKRCICYILHDVTDTRKMMEEFKSMATYDSMTHIYNRASFYQLSNHELDHASAQRTHISAIAIDIDKFKDINDTYGHFCGDVVIIGVVSRIAERLRRADIFGRVGGDEFNILLPNTNLENAMKVGRNLQKLISDESFIYEDIRIPVTLSIGVALFDEKRHSNLEDLLIDVDSALYQSKNAGRNTVCGYHHEEQEN